MKEQLRPLRCRARGCQEPPVYEVLGPVLDYYCEEHAQERLDEGMDERWVQLGEEAYLKEVMDVVDTLEELSNRSPTFRELCDDVMFYAVRELERARQAYVEVGGSVLKNSIQVRP